ncbi:MAG: DegT/DnrJ/EryC1/StrS family aminotransferase [Actinobacteria bacterium]|nr:DegT/DnrJ/EryC1/StrS family aminotransferase [Actinomycetota bacterium]
MIRISQPNLGERVEQLVIEVLRSGRLAQGPMVERFEELCRQMAGTDHAVAVSNGTAALDVALEAAGIGPGAEVITTPLTFAATLNAVLRSGADVRFAEVGEDFNIDPASVESLVNERTAAILPVHLYGLPADLPRLDAIAQAHGLLLIEDAAQAHGASVAGVLAGSAGIGTFSFYATKNVTAGEGGVVTTNDAEVADRIRLLRNQGMARPYDYQAIGHNLRMTELQAAVAIPQLEDLESTNAKRARNADHLATALRQACPAVQLPQAPADRVHVWHQFTVLLPEGADRDGVVAELAAQQIQAGIYYPSLVWDHPPYRASEQVTRDDTPRAAGVVGRCVSLPIHPGLGIDELDEVAAGLAKALSNGNA